jgi:hypothetical protein
VNISSGVITTAAGNTTNGYTGDGGPAAAAELAYPAGVTASASQLFIADTNNSVIRSVALS